MSLYRFQSRETADIIMMQPQGRKVLELLGKDPAAPGILLHQDLAAAIQTLRSAVLQEEARCRAAKEAAEADGESPPDFEAIGLGQRLLPLVEMLERCVGAGVELTWEVRPRAGG